MRVSTALSEIVVGTVALLVTGIIVLTFLAGFSWGQRRGVQMKKPTAPLLTARFDVYCLCPGT